MGSQGFAEPHPNDGQDRELLWLVPAQAGQDEEEFILVMVWDIDERIAMVP
jgi:hypothetical protein